MRISYNTSLLAESLTCLKSIEWLMYYPIESPFFSPVSDECKNSDHWLIYYVKIHTDDPHYFFPSYGHKLERRILDKILYEVDNTDISQPVTTVSFIILLVN
jgi:hypothetical protein